MDSPCRTKRLAMFLGVVLSGICAGCSDAVQLAHESQGGGVVTYLYQEDRGGPMGSPYHKEALQAIEKKCPTGYAVIRDGEAKGSGSLSTVGAKEGEITGRRWAIQFRCR